MNFNTLLTMKYFQNLFIQVGAEISGFHGGESKDIFWDVARCCLVEICRRFIRLPGGVSKDL